MARENPYNIWSSHAYRETQVEYEEDGQGESDPSSWVFKSPEKDDDRSLHKTKNWDICALVGQIELLASNLLFDG
jgi:hypothetical protein